MSDESGAQIAKYRLLAKLGEGGMGAVYLAEHLIMGKRVAVKVIRAEVAGPELVSRFINEARAAARIAHPGIVQVFDCGLDEHGRAFMAMELLRGESLGSFLRRYRTLSPHLPLVRRIARDTALAVNAAHVAGVVHRDLKPDNLFLVAHHDGPSAVELKVLDFGVAKLAAAISGPDAKATQSGALIGTAAYMSPEQCLGAKDIDGRTDVYALGCILFEMLAGRPPFANLGVGPTIAAHLAQDPPRVEDVAPGVDGALADLVSRMLAKTPGARPASMDAVARELAAGLPAGARAGAIVLPAGLSVPTSEPGQPAAPVAPTVDVAAGSQPTLPSGSEQAPVAAASVDKEASTAPRTTLSSSVMEVSRQAKRASGRARLGLGVLVVTGLGLAAVVALRPAPSGDDGGPPPPPPHLETVSLEVTGIPATARALLDGQVVTLPARLPRGAREHELRVEATGFEPFVDRIRADRDLRVAVTLKPIAPATAADAGAPATAKPQRPRTRTRDTARTDDTPKPAPPEERKEKGEKQGKGTGRTENLITDI